MKMTECLREVQMTSERASSDMCLVSQEARAQGQEHERRLADFLRRLYITSGTRRGFTPRTQHVAARCRTPGVRAQRIRLTAWRHIWDPRARERPWIVRQQNPRGFSNTSPARNRNSGDQQQSPKLNQKGNGNARTQNPSRRQTPVRDVKCWTCGKTGHYAYDCKSSGPKFAFAPKALKINFLQQIADQVQEYSEVEQNPGNRTNIINLTGLDI